MSKIRFEEYSPTAGFLMASFVRDQATIAGKFPKLDAAYVTSFQAKLAQVQQLEGTLKLTEDQKKATGRLYAEANAFNSELNFLSMYFVDSGLPTTAISELKRSLIRGNIEGALLESKDLKDYVVANEAALVENLMDAGFAAAIEAHRASLTTQNELQNSSLNARKTLVDANKAAYKELYTFIADVAKKGKLVFKDDVVEDEYNITRILGRMRSANSGGGGTPPIA